MTETEVAFAPTRLGARRRRLPPVVIGAAIVALLAVAVVKPWGAGTSPATPPTGDPDASGGPSAMGVAVAPEMPGADSSAVASAQITFPGLPHPGAWGISAGLDATSDPSGMWATWTGWVPLAPVSERPEPSIRDPLPTGTDCASVPTLAAAPSILGITVPDATSTDFSVLGWLSNGPWIETLDGNLARIDVPGRSRVALLASRNSPTFPDGRYDLHLLTSDHVTTLGFCLDSSAAPGPAAGGPDPEITARIVGELASRSGAWGVGTGGNGPRLIREEPWTDWAPVDPGPSWDGTSLTLWPDTGLCLGAPRLLNHPSLVAITVPSALVPDWRVGVWWTDGSQTAPLEGLIRQISPPGNRGITYLERVDRMPWPDGRYEFDIQAGDHRVSVTACIGAH